MLRIDLDRPSMVSIATHPGRRTSLEDPVVRLGDHRLTDAFFQDDDSNSLFPPMVLPLSAGRYFVRVFGLSRTIGTVTLAATRTDFTPPPLSSYRTTPGQLPVGNGTAAYRVRTPSPLEFRARDSDAGFDPMVAVLNRHGEVVSLASLGR